MVHAIKNKNTQDPFVGIKLALAKHPEVIIREIYELKNNEPIFYDDSGEQRVRGGNGKTTVAKHSGAYRIGSQASPKEEFSIYVKYYRGYNGSHDEERDYATRPEKPWLSEKQIYDKFAESNLVPRAFLFGNVRELRNKLVTLPAGNQTLERKILEVTEAAEKKGEDVIDAQMKVFLEVVAAQATLENYGKKRVWPFLQDKLEDEVKARGLEPIMPKAMRYLGDWLGYKTMEEIPSEIRTQFEHLYTPFAVVLDHYKEDLIHGDLDSGNIVGTSLEAWRGPDERGYNGNIRFIDLENMRTGHAFGDTARLATVPMSELGPEQCEILMKKHRTQRWMLDGIRPGEIEIRTGFLGLGSETRTIHPEMIDDAERAERCIMFTSCVHNPFKIGSRWKYRENNDSHKEDFAAMLNEKSYLRKRGDIYDHHIIPITKALEHIISHPNLFIVREAYQLVSFTEQDIGTISDLLKFFREHGIAK